MNLSDSMARTPEAKAHLEEYRQEIRVEKAAVLARLKWLTGQLESGEATTAEIVRDGLAFLRQYRAAPPEDPGDQMS